MGNNKTRDFDTESSIRKEVERIKLAHPYQGDYRAQLAALIETLFFKFGERAGASRLVTLLAQDGRSPSTVTALSELEKFWENLRATAQIRVNRPALPAPLLDKIGEVAEVLWNAALDQANEHTRAYRAEADQRTVAAVSKAEQLAQEKKSVQDQNTLLSAENQRVSQQLTETLLRLETEASARAEAELNAKHAVDRYHDQIRARTAEVQSLQSNITELTQSISQLQSEQRRLLVVADDYKQQAARDRERCSRTEQHLRDATEQAAKRQEELSALTQELGALQGRLASMREQHEFLQEERDRFMQNRHVLQAQYENLQQDHAASIVQLRRALECLHKARLRAMFRRQRRVKAKRDFKTDTVG